MTECSNCIQITVQVRTYDNHSLAHLGDDWACGCCGYKPRAFRCGLRRKKTELERFATLLESQLDDAGICDLGWNFIQDNISAVILVGAVMEGFLHCPRDADVEPFMK